MRLLSFALAIMCSISALAQEKVLLRLNLNPGDEHVAIYESSSRTEQSMMGSEQSAEESQMVRIHYTCIDTTGGIFKMKMDVERVTYENNGMLDGLSYDSDDPDEDMEKYVTPEGDMVEIDLTLSLAENGKIEAISGTDALADASIEHVFGFEEEDLETLLEQLKESFTSDAFTKEYSPCLVEFPEHEIGIGDSWTEIVSATTLTPLTVEMTYTVKEISETEVVLQARGQIRTPSDAEPTDYSGFEMKQLLSGSKAGTIKIERATGLVLSAEFEQSLSGKIEFLANEYFPEGQSFPLDKFDSMNVTTE
ncbi:DUF6263 family protein [Phaeocystidibacter luteus]|uniref:DUF4412 domain-containing protein n=1 Tax=Phaeocystidibacter luteus TaxID=911197 RepID=A0A6N6RDI5_9FLAO|nr:DUF6263 family protein [Phaeocystidibacter luteus]KAB2807347.1 hypothetical protein F8C67_12270 [Phaeocystidibacter luteus]